jgi:Tfp pilus assembly protein PilF
LYEQALAMQEHVLGREHPEVAKTLNGLAVLYDTRGSFAAAEGLYKRALAIAGKTPGSGDRELVTVLENYAVLLRKTDREAEAQAMEARATSIRADGN